MAPFSCAPLCTISPTGSACHCRGYRAIGSNPTPAADWVASWEDAFKGLLEGIPEGDRRRIRSIAFDGTSATCMLADRASGRVLTAAKLYNEAQVASRS